MKKIDKKTRDEAILVLLVEASTPDLTGNTFETCQALDLDAEVNDLAFDAWSRVSSAVSPGLPADSADIYAEVAQLLTEGWNPYDREDRLVRIEGAS